MKYMLLIYGNDQTWAALRADGMDAVHDAHRALMAEMKERGELVAADGLTTNEARVVRVVDGVQAVTDGPFTEAKEVVGGYAMVEVASRDEAMKVARNFMELHRVHWPEFEGECEVRPLDAGPPQ